MDRAFRSQKYHDLFLCTSYFCNKLHVSGKGIISSYRQKKDWHFLRKELLAAKESGYTEAVCGICFSILLENSNLSAICEIYLRLQDLLLWGYPLIFIEPRLQVDDYVDMLVEGIDNRDERLFAGGLEQIVRAIFVSSRTKIISVGIDAAKNVELPVLPPVS